MSAVPGLSRVHATTEQSRFAAVADRWRYPLAIYVISRVVYLLVAIADTFLRHEALGRELRNWDGKWYVLLAQYGYPHTLPVHAGNGAGGYSTLGFEPLYSMLMWLGGEALPRGVEASGLLISLVCGGIATVEIATLAERWWGREASRRGILFFCFFPGTIVFSMVYSEGLSLALVAGVLLCLEDRRWVLAGLLAGAATAVEPVAFALIPACAGVSLVHLRRAGWRDRDARRSLWAPLLSLWGAAGLGSFMWAWVGDPTAVFKAQRVAWGEKSSVLAMWRQGKIFVQEFTRWHGWSHVDLNVAAGLVGAVFMLVGLRWLWKLRHGVPVPGFADGVSGSALLQGQGVSLGAAIYTLFIFLETFTSDNTPPNPRMLVCAFPVVLAFAATRTGRNQRITLAITFALLVAMSIGSFAGGGLRP